MSYNFILLYSATVFGASIIPGPSMLLALSHGMHYGVRRTLVSALGNITVSLLQALVSFAGLGTLLLASDAAFQLVKLAGAAYLVYMGVGLLFASPLALSAGKQGEQPPVSLAAMYGQAALVTAGNPKAILFFTAVFPQFINPDGALLPQICVLSSLGSLIAFSCFMVYAFSGQKLVVLFSQAAVGRYLTRIIGGTFIGAGIGLALSGRE